jgi:hypothetical protein
MKTTIISKYAVKECRLVKLSKSEYKRLYQEAIKEFGNLKVKVDDGYGRTAWKFFESAEDLCVWKNQK